MQYDTPRAGEDPSFQAAPRPDVSRKQVTVDGNTAAAHVAYACNEVIAIYPITPSSTMGEICDEKASQGEKNLFGTVPLVAEMQSEGGAAGAVHGALQTGALTTTFTASQGLLLMIPNMYKIAGELTPTVFHVTARALATSTLSIFGDHSDVMATRQTGWAMLCSGNVQEVMDFALISQAATLEARVPFLHFFDGFRTSHEINKIEELTHDDMRAMLSMERISEHRRHGLSPDHPVVRGTAQNPDTFFQTRETVNRYYEALPGIVQASMDRFARLVGRQYHLFDYVGPEDADMVLVMMGSGAETAEETITALAAQGWKVGLIKVRLFRPFSARLLLEVMPKTTRRIAVLDRTKEPGSNGEPLYHDVLTAIYEGLADGTAPFQERPLVVGGRYGLGSKEFTPAMVMGIVSNLASDRPKNHFTVGIVDDVTQTSIPFDPAFTTEDPETVRALFYGLGSDGTVGANKNSIKIIGEETPNYAQGYFVYDSKKSGSTTISHLRFGRKPIRATYQIRKASFIACHQFFMLEQRDMLADAEEGATFLLNSPFGPEEVWNKLPELVQQRILAKRLKFYVIDATRVARETGMGRRINTIMQTCFFAISNVLPRAEAIAEIKRSIAKSYGAKGEAVVQKNFLAVDQTLANLFEVQLPDAAGSGLGMKPPVSEGASAFVRDVLGAIIEGKGDELPVSAMPCDGTFPTGTSRFEKRNIAEEIPVLDTSMCIQCGKCAMVCPHAAIRTKMIDSCLLADAPETFKAMEAKGVKGKSYLLQVAPEDCTGCGACVFVCPAKDKQDPERKAIMMAPQAPLREPERVNFQYFLDLPETDRSLANMITVKGTQLVQPLFEFSGACSGCGETPYLKMLTQLFGDHMMVSNATGCSSIYGGNLPTTPWTTNKQGRGPSWANSLFEDNAEFGFGMRLATDKFAEQALELLRTVPELANAPELVESLLNADQSTQDGVDAQRARVEVLLKHLEGSTSWEAGRLRELSEYLVKRTLWIVGGDGWAYDIGFGGLDHVLASGRNVNILVLDTEVYSNTGGQSSKSTPTGAVAKFANSGKATAKKDLARMAMSYGHVYVATVAYGANDAQTVRALTEAAKYDGPSLVIAYSPCIAHGLDMARQPEQQDRAVKSGHWPLFRYNPELAAQGKNPFALDSKAPAIPFKDYAYAEGRYRMLAQSDPERAEELLARAEAGIATRWAYLSGLANPS